MKVAPTLLSRVWGLTGGIASGKSTAARLFQEEGLPVIDADQISRSLSQPGGAAYQQILTRFGTADRKKLRELVFSDPQARKDLEAILHPLIRKTCLEQIQSLGDQTILYEAALLVETGTFREFRGLIVVDAPREIRMKRLMERDQCSSDQAEKILASQINDEERRSKATHILNNSGTIETLRAQVKALTRQIRK